MINKKKEFTSDMVKCMHCGNSSRLVIFGSVDTTETEYDADGRPGPDQGEVFDVLGCESCSKVTIRSYYWTDAWEEEGDKWVEFKYLYPPEKQKKRIYGLPPEIQKGYQSAQAVKDIDANAYGVLLRRLLEQICINQNAIGKSLHLQLQDLATKNIIPSTLSEIADGLKKLGNVGAHAGSGDLTSDETDLMTSLCEAVIEYVYSAPKLVKQAQAVLDKVKSKT